MSSLRTVLFGALFLFSTSAFALDLDWHGQFRTETNWLFGYSHGQLANPAVGVDQGYFIPQNGDSPASFQNIFFRLDPRVIVTDNVSLHTDIWFGTPDRGIFGGDTTGTSNFFSTSTGNASITGHEFYAEIATDFGTLTAGRAPLNWGLGLIWNNNKDGFDRLPSTGDVIRLNTKLGSFRFTPGIIKYRNGSNYGGTAGATVPGTVGISNFTQSGASSATDYTVALAYDNDDEQLSLGLLFMRRIAGLNAQIINPFYVYPTTATATTSPTTSGYAYNVWDFYAKKHAGIFTLSAEVPLVTGIVASNTYSTVAAAGKVVAQLNDRWSLKLNLGKADGQGNLNAGQSASKLTAFYFHPDVRPGFLMFNYNLRNLSNSSLSPYDNPVNNARYLSMAADLNAGKWSHEFLFLYAVADKTADGVANNLYFNGYNRVYNVEAGGPSQDNHLGFETDYTLGYDWDESIRLGMDLGLYFPGRFYEFSNSATKNVQKTVFGSSLNLLVRF